MYCVEGKTMFACFFTEDEYSIFIFKLHKFNLRWLIVYNQAKQTIRFMLDVNTRELSLPKIMTAEI